MMTGSRPRRGLTSAIEVPETAFGEITPRFPQAAFGPMSATFRKGDLMAARSVLLFARDAKLSGSDTIACNGGPSLGLACCRIPRRHFYRSTSTSGPSSVVSYPAGVDQSHRAAFFDPAPNGRSVPLTRQCLSLLAERDYRVNPRSPQGWDQACEYANHK
jgi:hypothetical protein